MRHSKLKLYGTLTLAFLGALLLCLFLVAAFSHAAQTPVPAQNVHSIKISWITPTTGSTPVSYVIYRSTVAGGPYTQMSVVGAMTVPTSTTPGTSPVTSWNDATGTPGIKYFYVVSTRDSLNVESVPVSNEASATFPANPVSPGTVTAIPQ